MKLSPFLLEIHSSSELKKQYSLVLVCVAEWPLIPLVLHSFTGLTGKRRAEVGVMLLYLAGDDSSCALKMQCRCIGPFR